MAAIQGELGSALARLSCVTVEGEPGIGKTRLLLSSIELADQEGFAAVAVAADEELRGPFLLMRSILSSALSPEGAVSPEGALPRDAEAAVRRALEAMSGRDDSTLEALPPDQKLLRQFDLIAMAFQALASTRPLALFVDDLQWADEDSLRGLRYVVRTAAAHPIFLLLALRPEETAFLTEAVTFIADMERMGLVRRLRLGRFTQIETAAFLRQLLGAEVNPSSAAAMHAQAEGVPFILEELVHAYSDTGMVQQIDGVWSLARNAERLVPSAVQTLIQRRSGRLPEATKASLAEAAVLGRSFSLRDLLAVKLQLGDDARDAGALAEAMAPAVSAGLLAQHPQGSAADYSFNHEQVRQFAMSSLSPPRRRAIHAAVVQMLTEGGEPSSQSLPMLAHHAAAAGDTERCARFSIASAKAALAAHAPEEVLRAVDLALPAASGPQDRVTLLGLRDDALDMLRRPGDRLEGLAELAALADALGDPHLELRTMLRRAAAFRLAEEHDVGASLADEVRELAAKRGDRAAEMAACLELGQALLRSPLGEGFVPSAAEVDLDGAEEAFGGAAALAEELGDDAALAGASRELGIIEIGRVRAWFVDRVKAGEHVALMARAVGGETPDQMLPTLPIAPIVASSQRHLDRALQLFEKLEDRRGVMSSVIAMAYLRFGPEIHMGASPAQRIEEIRRLATRMRSLSKESERALAEAQMLYGVHVFARAKVIPDLAISRGEDAYRAAKTLGDRALEFSAAGGVAMALLDLGDVEEAERWLGLAASAASAAPTPLRARRLELWRGLARATAGDAAGMREHLGRALRAATDQGRPAGRCEVLARLAVEAARLGAAADDEELLSLAERSAREAKELVRVLPGHPPWGAQADAALADVALARGDLVAAGQAGRAAMQDMQSAMREDLYPEILLPTARAIFAAGEEHEKQMAGMFLKLMVAMVAQRTVDEDVRVRWFRGPIGREWVRLVGPVEMASAGAAGDGALAGLGDADARLLGLLTEGLTNDEIAGRLGTTPQSVALRLQEMFAKIGASSRAEATAFALREGVL